MCGIVGSIATGNVVPSVIEGMSYLEYRGCDSSGVAGLTNHGELLTTKVVGGIESLKNALAADSGESSVMIGHLRWATHGAATQTNAHPLLDCSRSSAVVHNGIIENYSLLKEELSSRHIFVSETDSEVIAHLFEEFLDQTDSLEKAITLMVEKLKGAYACVLMSKKHPNILIALRNKSPLCIGLGKDQIFIASDPQAFIEHTQKVIFLEDTNWAIVSAHDYKIFDFKGNSVTLPIKSLDRAVYHAHQGHYPHFMLKEIYEQKRVIYDTVAYLRAVSDQDILQICASSKSALEKIDSITLIGCGTSAYAAAIGRYFIERIAQIPVTVGIASEYRYNPYFASPTRLSCVISQSGETADTLEVLRLCHSYGERVIALTNIATSTIARESHGFLLMQAQREISVASTKCFTAQLVLLYAFAHRLAALRGSITSIQVEQAYQELLVAAEILEEVLVRYKKIIIDFYASFYSKFDRLIFLGKEISFPFAQEAGLKLKEIAYLMVESYPSGELKHGLLALIDEHTPVFVFSLLDEHIYSKLVSGAQEVKARKGHLLVFAFEGQTELIALADHAFIIPRVAPLLAPVAMTALMQFLMYEIARNLDRPIDRPRHLAKSITVE